MYARLLVCTDGSPYGTTACEYGMLMARALQARMTALHVLDIRVIEGPLLADVAGMIGAAEYFASLPNFRNLMAEKGQSVCQSVAARAAETGTQAECRVETGHPLHTILAAQNDADLLVLGRRGENEVFGRELIGSVAERVVRRAHLPCLVTASRFAPVTHILAATDGSLLAGKAVETAAQLAVRMGTALTVVSVAEKTDAATAHQTASAAADTVRGRIPGVGVTVREGDAADGIVSAATDVRADLVVMGAHSHSRLREWFVGCTTLRILADSALPTLLVR